MKLREVTTEITGFNSENFLLEFSSMKRLSEELESYERFQNARSGAQSGGSDSRWVCGDYDSDSIEDIIVGKSEFELPKELAFMRSSGTGQRRRKRYSEMGVEVDAMRALTGSMMPFVEKTRIDSSGRNIRIVISTTISASQDTNDIKLFMQACVEEAYRLSASGYMVSIESALVSRGTTVSGKGVISLVKVKDEREPFDWRRISTMIYPAFYRLYMIQSADATGVDIRGTYGSPVSGRENIQKFMHEHVSDKAVVLDFLDWKKNGALKYDRSIINK